MSEEYEYSPEFKRVLERYARSLDPEGRNRLSPKYRKWIDKSSWDFTRPMRYIDAEGRERWTRAGEITGANQWSRLVGIRGALEPFVSGPTREPERPLPAEGINRFFEENLPPEILNPPTIGEPASEGLPLQDPLADITGRWGAPTQMPFMPPMPTDLNNPLLTTTPFNAGGVPPIFGPQYQSEYPNYTPAGVMDWGNYMGGFK